MASGLHRRASDVPPLSVIVEAWAQGLNVGALVFISLIVLCNYRRHITLHKLILLELILALWHGFYIFFPDPSSNWALSITAVPLYISYTVHNVVAWIKIKPFLPRWGGLFFIGSLMVVQPFWILEMWANFAFFNSLYARVGSMVFPVTRCIEPLVRDPWWVYTTVRLVRVINTNYGYTLPGLVHISPRFGILLMCMFVSIVFVIVDLVYTAKSVSHWGASGSSPSDFQSGVNPFWRLSLVFKCASDAFFLDDFKSVLDRIAKASIKDIANVPTGSTSGFKDDSAVRNPFSSGRRRLSSFGGIRRPSNAAPSRRQFSPGARVEHVSLNGDPTVDEEERAIIDSPSAPPKAHHSRDLWGTAGDTGTSSARFSTHCRPGESTSNGPRPGQILAETTITISENDEGRESPQEMRQSQTSSSRSDYLYGEGPRGEASLDPEMGMPLSSLRPKS